MERVPGEPRPELPDALASEVRRIIFWSFFLSQGGLPTQNRILEYAVSRIASKDAAILAAHCSGAGDLITFSDAWERMITQPLIAQIQNFVGSHAHSRGAENSIQDTVLGGVVSQNATESDPPMKAFARSLLYRRGRIVSTEDTMNLLHVAVERILSRDDMYARSTIGRGPNKDGRHVSIFTDPHLSHVCHFGFLRHPLPPGVPQAYTELMRELPRIVLNGAHISGQVALMLENIIERHNETHKEKVPDRATLEKQFGIAP